MKPFRNSLVDTVRHQPVPWLPNDAVIGNVALSSRVRLARNVAGMRFPSKLTPAERRRVQLMTAEAIATVPGLSDGLQVDVAKLEPADRQLLAERRLIEGEPRQDYEGQGLFLTADEAVSVAVNEVDHLHVWAVRPGLELTRLWHEVQAVEAQLAQRMKFAFDEQLGYLTARPLDVGTGLRMAVLLHLPALTLAEQMGQIRTGLEAVGMVLESVFYDDERALGNLYEIANGDGLGQNEENVLARVQRVAGDLVAQERHTRQRLAHDHPDLLADAVGRAYGVLRHAYRLSAGEAVGMLSALRLGLDLGMIETLDLGTLNRLLLLTQPGHLAAECGDGSADEDGDRLRATVMRESLRQVDRQTPGKS